MLCSKYKNDNMSGKLWIELFVQCSDLVLITNKFQIFKNIS